MNAVVEKRSQQRLAPAPQPVTAELVVSIGGEAPKILNGLVEDMGYGGIRIRLYQPLPGGMDGAQVHIVVRLPQSGVPLSIHGVIRHIVESATVGMQFADPARQEADLDDFLFECVKHGAHQPLIPG